MPVQVASLTAVLDLDKKGFDRGLNAAQAVLTGLSTGVATRGLQLLEDGARAVVGAMADSVSKAADLQSQLDAVGAISGATEEQVAGLKETVMDLGIDPKLKVSAFEAAAAVEELAAGGVALEEIMNGAAKGTVALANATGADFAQAGEIAASSMAVFGVEAKDLEQVIDGVAAVAVQSKFDVNDYALALAQGGGAAKTYGVELDDFNTTLAATAHLFASGSDSGTSMKTFLQRLVPTTKPATEAMRDLGLLTGLTSKEMEKAEEKLGKIEAKMAALDPTSKNYADKLARLQLEHETLSASMVQGQNAFFTAEGQLKSMAEIAGLLDTAMSGLSEEQRNVAMQTIFGTDAMRAAVGLMETGEQGFRSLQETMSQTSGLDAAAQRMGNFKGSMEILQGVIEGLQIQFGDKLLPKLDEFAQKVTGFLSNQGPGFVDVLANATLAVLAFAEKALPTIQEFLAGAGPIFEQFGTKFSEIFGPALASMADSLNRIGIALGLTTGNLTGMEMAWNTLKFGLDQIILTLQDVAHFLDSVADFLEVVGPPIKARIDDFIRFKNAITGLSDSTKSWTDRIEELGQALGEVALPDWLAGSFKNDTIKALSSSLALPGFAAGGMVPGLKGEPLLAMVHGGEMIIPPGETGGHTYITNLTVGNQSFGPFTGAGGVDQALTQLLRMMRLQIETN